MIVDFMNSTLGQRCVNFTAGISRGIIENDQNFTVSLQDIQTPSDVNFPSGQTASVQVMERESMSQYLCSLNTIIICFIN